MKPQQHPVCPACGFRVFNRRYPRCESCGAQLPEATVYNESEREALLQSEVERLDKEHEERKIAAAKADAEATRQLAKAALVLSVIAVANSGRS